MLLSPLGFPARLAVDHRPETSHLPLAKRIYSAPYGRTDDVIMAMLLVDVGCNHIFVLALESFVRKLLSNFMRLFRCHFTDVKGLNQMTGKCLRHLHSLLHCKVSCPLKFFRRRVACGTPIGRNIEGIFAFTASRRFSVSECTWWSYARYPERETPEIFNIPETETRRPAFLAASVFSDTSR